MTSDKFKAIYPGRVLQSSNYTDLRPIIAVIAELTCCEDCELELSYKILVEIEKDLINHGILSSIVKYEDDISGDIKSYELKRYIQDFLYRYKEVSRGQILS